MKHHKHHEHSKAEHHAIHQPKVEHGKYHDGTDHHDTARGEFGPDRPSKYHEKGEHTEGLQHGGHDFGEDRPSKYKGHK